MSFDEKEDIGQPSAINDTETADIPEARSGKEKLIYAIVFATIFIFTYIMISIDPEVSPSARKYSGDGFSTLAYTPMGRIAYSLFASIIILLAIDTGRSVARNVRNLKAAGQLREYQSFGNWYSQVFGKTSAIAQVALWFFYGFFWIPIWYFVSAHKNFSPWNKKRLGRLPFVIQLILWFCYGFIWIPIWYFVEKSIRRRKVES
jgi:hypothetical protein